VANSSVNALNSHATTSLNLLQRPQTTYISSRICEFLLGVKDIPMHSPISGLGIGLEYQAEREALRVRGGSRDAATNAASGARRQGGEGCGQPEEGAVWPDEASVPGMLDVSADEGAIEKTLGAAAVPIDLEAVLEAARAAPPGGAAEAAQSPRSLQQKNRDVSPGSSTQNQ
jgi:hypothetical protein